MDTQNPIASLSTSTPATTPTTELDATALPTPMPSYEQTLLLQFYDDANVPTTPAEIRNLFTFAVQGNGMIQQDIWHYTENVAYAVFPNSSGKYSYTEDECLFNIGMYYYNGDTYINFVQDKAKAFEWLKLSAAMGNSSAAVQAGDMVQTGDGVPADSQAAFDFYSAAIANKPDAAAFERLGECYENGIGIAADRQKAYDYYCDSAFMGYSVALYKLTAFTEYTSLNMTALYKAASSQDYSAGYFARAYGGLAGYSADDAKLNLIDKLSALWDNGTDSAAVKLRKNIPFNEYFPKDFVEDLMKTSYAYSYFAFAEKYGLQPNRTVTDTADIQFASTVQFALTGDEFDYNYSESMAQQYLQYDDAQYYEYDFNGDGVDEIGVPIHSGAGGAFSTDGFGIFSKNSDGLYESCAGGFGLSFRDAMRIIRYDGKVYFIANPYDDTGNTPNDIDAYTVDKDNIGHEVTIACNDYSLQTIVTDTDPTYADGYNSFFSDVDEQARDAAEATKQGIIYSPAGQTRLAYKSDDSLWGNIMWFNYPGDFTRNDIFVTADINNDGSEEVVHIGHLTTQLKYDDDYHWFQIYNNRDDFDNGTVSLTMPEYHDDFYGMHTGGNIYDLLPLKNKDNVVQFWTYNYNGTTYCMTLQRYGLLYTVQIYKIQGDRVSIVGRSLLFDEAQGMDLSFS